MSTIRSISDTNGSAYTVVTGGLQHGARHEQRRLSIVVLNRGGRVGRSEQFQRLESWDGDILSIEGPNPAYDVEALAAQYPSVRFLILKRAMSTGERVNLAVEEARGRLVLVVWNDMQVQALSERVLNRIDELACVCSVPTVRTERGQTVPSLRIPAFYGGLLRVVPETAAHDEGATIYPYDYVGIYNRERFLQTTGYDPAIESPYWQKLDFGFRAFMWGEELRCFTAFRITQLADPPPEDTTLDHDYRRFYLKNLAVRFLGDHGALGWSRFFRFFVRTKGSLVSAIRLFREARAWVRRYRYHFVQEAARVTELWEYDGR